MVTQTQIKPKGEVTRKKLLVLSVDDPKVINDKGTKKLCFKASDDSGHDYSYFTFRESLFESIKANATLDSEIETSTREYEGNTYTDRKVNQIFVGGEPVAQKKPFVNRGKSPEEIADIRAQCAFKLINQAWCAGKLNTDHPLIDRLMKFMDMSTASFPTVSRSAPAPVSADKAFDNLKSAAKPLVPGTDEWIKLKVKELNIDVALFLEFVNKNLHIPIEINPDKSPSLEKSLLGWKEADRMKIAQAIEAKEKKKPS
jgi:hypothetical protein